MGWAGNRKERERALKGYTHTMGGNYLVLFRYVEWH